MKTITVQAQPDHIARLTQVRKPLAAVVELIWNGFDADATRVAVRFNDGALGEGENISVIDNGLGMSQSEADNAFERLGGSWKRFADRTRGESRQLHGKWGRGRFKAFALGNLVEWTTTARTPLGDSVQSMTITGVGDSLTVFRVSDPVAVSAGASSGTEVTIHELRHDFRGLRGAGVEQELLEEFAIYLRQYPHARIEYDGRTLEPESVVRHATSHSVPRVTLDDGRVVEATLDIIEWSFGTRRALFLCDASGFALHETTQGLPSFAGGYSAYLRSDFVRALDEEHLLDLEDVDPGLKALIDAARGVLREHVRRRIAEAGAEAVEDWKRQEVYPYPGEPKSPVEVAERQVFDVVALSVREHLPNFGAAGQKEQKFAFRLIREALERDPGSLQTILTEVLGLPEKERQDLAELLQQTSLSQIISASRVVTERLDFIKALEVMVFEPDVKKVIRERTQLHRILERHTWIFGEHFHLTVSDQSLNEVLAKHRHILGHEALREEEEVLRLDGSRGIVDLMLTRTIPQPRADEHEHLIVELKAPTQPINAKVITQAKSYAFAVAEDERFLGTSTRWNFWAVSNRLSSDARHDTKQRNRPEGLVYESDDGRIQVWAKSWSQIIDAAKARMAFFQQQFAYEATRDSAVALLRRLHSDRIPDILAGSSAGSTGGVSLPDGVVPIDFQVAKGRQGRAKGKR